MRLTTFLKFFGWVVICVQKSQDNRQQLLSSNNISRAMPPVFGTCSAKMDSIRPKYDRNMQSLSKTNLEEIAHYSGLTETY